MTGSYFAQELRKLMERARELMEQAEEETLPADVLDPEHLATLHRLHTLCTRCDSNGDCDINEDELRPVKKQRKLIKTKLGGPKDPWKRITNLEKLPDVAEYISIYIKRYSGDAENFLRTSGLAHDFGEHTSKDDLGNAFMARYCWTQKVERRDEQVHVLKLFNDLFWFDIMQLIRPKGSGRVGGVMLEELDRFLTPLHLEKIGFQKSTVTKNVGEWSIRGSKINKICTIYGPGVILILHRQLSKNFLESKFTASGDYFEGALNRLNNLGLKTHIFNTGVETLASSIRMLMIKPFQDAYDNGKKMHRKVTTKDSRLDGNSVESDTITSQGS